MSARKRIMSTPPLKCVSRSRGIVKKLSNDSSLPSNETAVADSGPSQRYMQHKLDMTYNKYIQNLMLQNILEKYHKETLRSCDEQLLHYEEIHESAAQELKSKNEYLHDITTTLDFDAKIKFLETVISDINKFMDDKEIVQNINQINQNLEQICNNLKLQNLTFVNNDESHNKLQMIFKELTQELGQINEGNSENFTKVIDNIFISKDLITKLKKNHEYGRYLQNKLNKLVLKTASLELSKYDDEEINTTPM